jgi:hypothetical protein
MRSIGSGLSSPQSGHGTSMMVMVMSGFMAASSIDQVTSEITIARLGKSSHSRHGGCPLWVISGHAAQKDMSALPPKADMYGALTHVR